MLQCCMAVRGCIGVCTSITREHAGSQAGTKNLAPFGNGLGASGQHSACIEHVQQSENSSSLTSNEKWGIHVGPSGRYRLKYLSVSAMEVTSVYLS